MTKKKYIAPAITVLDCEMQNCILAASDAMQWNPGVGDNMNIYDEDDDLNDEITG
ncbi:hypothetical protein [Prevotella sp.]|uniref:hypothetical protein n=1 Tax=Prevotella sp. TaxID=59823 RepID=UPI00307775A5